MEDLLQAEPLAELLLALLRRGGRLLLVVVNLLALLLELLALLLARLLLAIEDELLRLLDQVVVKVRLVAVNQLAVSLGNLLVCGNMVRCGNACDFRNGRTRLFLLAVLDELGRRAPEVATLELEDVDLVGEARHAVLKRLGDRTLMVTQNGSAAVRAVVRKNKLGLRRLGRRLELDKLALRRVRKRSQ